MARRFLLQTRYADDANLNSQLTQHRLQGLGYRRRTQLRQEGEDVEHRQQLFERQAADHETLQVETERLKSAGVWPIVRFLRLL